MQRYFIWSFCKDKTLTARYFSFIMLLWILFLRPFCLNFTERIELWVMKGRSSPMRITPQSLQNSYQVGFLGAFTHKFIPQWRPRAGHELAWASPYKRDCWLLESKTMVFYAFSWFMEERWTYKYQRAPRIWPLILTLVQLWNYFKKRWKTCWRNKVSSLIKVTYRWQVGHLENKIKI